MTMLCVSILIVMTKKVSKKLHKPFLCHPDLLQKIHIEDTPQTPQPMLYMKICSMS